MNDANQKMNGKKSDFKFIDPANMNTTVNPGENFFEYANGTWLKNTQIPSDQTRWGSFDILAQDTKKQLKTLLDQVSEGSSFKKGSQEQLVADFYKSGMDTKQIEQEGLNPLKPYLERINKISNQKQLLDEILQEEVMGVNPLFGFYVAPDDKEVTTEICQFFQGGLGLSPKDAYFDEDERSKKNREAYVQYINDMGVLMGLDKNQAATMAQSIFDLEKKMAGASLSPVEMRDPQRLYNKFDISGLNQQTPNLDWAKILKGLKADGQKEVIVGMPDFFKTLSELLTTIDLSIWKAYLSFHLVSNMASYLSDAFSDLKFNFYGKVVYGQKEQKARWKRVLGVVDGGVGEALGQLYVKQYFPPEAKKRMNDLVQNLQDAFSERIQNLDWMSQATKEKALIKLNAFTKKIAYPDKWRDYTGLEIMPDNYVQNVLNASAFDYAYNIQKLGKPVDKTEWGMTPPTINAYYNPGFNEIVFPAGILQFPFFDFNADDAINYGGIGAVIGHEMTHGFDDQGAQYDDKGYLRNWWTEEDAKKFKAKTEVVENQFNQYKVIDEITVNGALTLGENLADLGGVTIAYDAFKKTKQGQSEETIGGFTGDQRFFLSWAQVWRSKITPEAQSERIKTDPHSPSRFRCNGPLSNFEPFYHAFGVKKGDKMWREEKNRAKVW